MASRQPVSNAKRCQLQFPQIVVPGVSAIEPDYEYLLYHIHFLPIHCLLYRRLHRLNVEIFPHVSLQHTVVLKNSRLRPHPSPHDVSMTSLTSFPNFAQLPAEIRLMIWEFAARNTLGYHQLRTGMLMSNSNLVTRYIAFPGEVAHGFGGILLKRFRRDGYYFPLHSGAPSLMHTCHDSRRALLEQLRHGFIQLGPHINQRGDRSYNEAHVAQFYDRALRIIERLLEQTKGRS